LLGIPITVEHACRLRDWHSLWSRFQTGSSIRFYTIDTTAAVSNRSHNPARATPAGFIHTHGLASSAFARHYSRIHNCFLFLRVLRCFTSPRSLYPPYTFRRESLGHKNAPSRVSPFGNPRITARLSAPQGLSQIATSFFGSRCQGIHRLLLKT